MLMSYMSHSPARKGESYIPKRLVETCCDTVIRLGKS
jgi:hypothetical protein